MDTKPFSFNFGLTAEGGCSEADPPLACVTGQEYCTELRINIHSIQNECIRTLRVEVRYVFSSKRHKWLREMYQWTELKCFFLYLTFLRNIGTLLRRGWLYVDTYFNKIYKLPSTQLVNVMSLIWQHVSTSEGHLQASSIKYIKGIVYNCITFWAKISALSVWE